MKKREFTLTGSLSIRVASFRANGSLISSICFGRKEGNLSSAAAEIANRRRWILHSGNKVRAELAEVRVSIFRHPRMELATHGYSLDEVSGRACL